MRLRSLQRNDPWVEGLAAAIVEQAVWDYEDALVNIEKYSDPTTTETILRRKRKRNASYEDADRERSCHLRYWLRMRKDCETFFRSGWFGLLCGLDGAAVMEQIQKRLKVQEE